MVEISKLRQRLKNVNKNVTEYRMTVNEARQLLQEIDGILQEKEKPEVIEDDIYTPPIITRVMDGGTF